MKPTNSESAAWHREQAAHLRKSEAVMRSEGDAELAGAYARIAAHHEVAAAVLDALAVPGVAELLTMLAQDGACVTAGIGGEYPDDAQRAALTTLVKIGGDR